MKKIFKKIFSILMVFAVISYNFLPFMPMIKVKATTALNEIRITSDTTVVSPGELPSFTASTTTEHITSIEGYGSNTNWSYWGEGSSSWNGFGLETPTAVDDGKTHYALNLCVNLEDGYAFNENTKVYFNGTDVTTLGHTGINAMSWGGYVVIDLGTAGEPLSIYTISYDSNGGTGTMSPQVVYEGETVDLKMNKFTAPSGMSFDKWKIGETYYDEDDAFTPTSNTVVKATWTDKYIRESRASMSPSTISSDISANDLVFTSLEPSKYDVSLWRVFDLTDGSLNTESGKYPATEKFVSGHEYAIEFTFSSVGNYYEYDETTDGRTSTFYLNDQETDISSATAVGGSVNRRVSLTTTNGQPSPVVYTVTFKDGNNILDTRNIVSGDTVQRPSDPIKGNLQFDNWYANAEFNALFDFNTPITQDTNIFARWNDDNNQNNEVVRLQLDGATVSENVITFNAGETNVAATVTGTGYSFESGKDEFNNDKYTLVVNVADLNNVKLVLSNNFDSSKMKLKLHNGQELTVTGDNEAIFDGLDFSQDNSPHLGLYMENNNGGQEPVGGTEDITFNITVNDTYALVDINGKEVIGEGKTNQVTYTFNNVLVEQAGETDSNKTNVIKITPQFGEHDILNCTINNVTYTLESENVEYNDYGWFITVPGSENYTITVNGDVNSDTQRTIIWVNPDYEPKDEEDANWVSNFTISHGTARVIEVYDKDNHLVDPNTYVGEGADEYGLRDGFGWVAIYPGSRVIFEFVPEYGYQLTGIAINETPLDAIDGNENMNRFEVEIPTEDAGNLHFAATFTRTEDVVKAESEKVTSGEINLGNDLDGGSAQLTVNDITLSKDKVTGFEKAAGDYTIANYLDIDLYNVYYKGKSDDQDIWSTKIDELENEATISLKLADGITADDIVIVHNIHDGEQFEIIEIESYDPKTNTITFKTKSFSNYAIATKNIASKNPLTLDFISTWIYLFAISIIGLAFTVLRLRKIFSK